MNELPVLHVTDLPVRLRLVGLHGRMQSGKDTFGKAIAQHARCHHISFANALKEACLAVFGGERDNYFGSDEQKNEVAEFWALRLGDDWATYRKIMQRVGTETFRENVHWQIWVWATELRIIQLYQRGELKEDDVLLWADVRYDNEAYAVRKFGGVVLHIVNTNQPEVAPEHSSEAGIDPAFVSDVYRFASADDNRTGAKNFIRGNEYQRLVSPVANWEPQQNYTVVGYHYDTGERWSRCVRANSAESAEAAVLAEDENVVVCGTVGGCREVLRPHQFTRRRDDLLIKK